ncbi:MAG TPA: hypothetical protein DIT48_08460 [Actinobacteria bacterium]|jgi:CRP-like cAMP-binding protein|nr:hypothetical protein [Actinomycetota bacterium]
MARGIPQEVIRHFKAVPLFSRLSAKGVRAVVQAATEVSVASGKTLVRQGQSGRELFVVIEGEAEVIRSGRRIATIGPGDFVGELAFLSRTERTASVIATTAMKVMVLGSRELDVLVEQEPSLVLQMLAVTADRLRSLEKSSHRL